MRSADSPVFVGVVLATLAFLSPAVAKAQIRVTSSVRFGSSADDFVYAGDVDGAGDVHLLGITTSFGVSGEAMLFAKLDPSGGLVWMRTWDRPGDDIPEGFTLTAGGISVASGTTPHAGTGDDDAFVLAYDASGTVLWAKGWDDAGGDDALDDVVAHLDAGSEFLFAAGQKTEVGAPWSTDLLFQRLDPSTGAVVWSRAWSVGPGVGSTEEGANAVAYDPTANVLYAAGHFTDDNGSTGRDALLVQLSTGGTVNWARTWHLGGCDDAYNVTPDGFGGAYLVAGTHAGVDCDDRERQIALARFDGTGALLWDRVYTSGQDDGYGVAVDPATNDVYVSGETNFSVNGQDAIVICFDSAGARRWTRTWGELGVQGLGFRWFGSTLVALGGTSSCGGELRSCDAGVISDPAATVAPRAGITASLTTSTIALTTAATSRVPGACSGIDAVFLTLEPTDVGSAYCFGDGSGSPCPCSNPGCSREGCANSTGRGAQLQARGSASVGADDLELLADGSIPGQPGLFFQGDNAVNSGAGLAFGDGLRCAGGSVVRLQVIVADAGGAAVSTDPIAADGGVSPGDLKRYQWWYRNPTGSPCSTSFNLSNGLEISWAP